MEATTIRCLRPNVTREEALQTFTSSGPASLYWKWRSGSLQRIADAYIPFRIYRVRYPMNGTHHTCLFALDAVDATDLFNLQPAQRCRNRFRPPQSPTSCSPRSALDNCCAIRFYAAIFQQGF